MRNIVTFHSAGIAFKRQNLFKPLAGFYGHIVFVLYLVYFFFEIVFGVLLRHIGQLLFYALLRNGNPYRLRVNRFDIFFYRFAIVYFGAYEYLVGYFRAVFIITRYKAA